jgi:hypothetical protein
VSFPSTAAGGVCVELSVSRSGAAASDAFATFALASLALSASLIRRTRYVLLGLRVVLPVTSANLARSSFSFILPSFAVSFFVVMSFSFVVGPARARPLTQRFARHKSILTTAVYSHPTDEDLVRAVDGMPC